MDAERLEHLNASLDEVRRLRWDAMDEVQRLRLAEAALMDLIRMEMRSELPTQVSILPQTQPTHDSLPHGQLLHFPATHHEQD